MQLKSNDRNFLLAAPDQPSYDLWFDEFTKTKSRLFTRKVGFRFGFGFGFGFGLGLD